MSGYEADGQDRYAAILEQREGPPFAARHGLSADDYQRAFDELIGQGFRPVKISGYAIDGQERFAAIFEQRDGPRFVARHGIGGDEYQRTFDDLVAQGFRLVETEIDRLAVRLWRALAVGAAEGRGA